MQRNFKIISFSLLVLGIVSIFINLNTGFLELNFSDFLYQSSSNQEVIQLRINRVLVMILAGIAIPTSGFILQEYFKNPLAGPSVLGITSASNLSVAFFVLFAKNWDFPEIFYNGIMSGFSIVGSVFLMMILLIFNKINQEKSHIIIFGFLVSALSGTIINILQFYAENETLKSYILWSFGGNNQVTSTQIFILFILIIIGLFFTFKSIKPLIGMSLGINYAQTMGINLPQLKIFIIIASSLLSSSITAFLGPVFFIGVIIPHFCRMLWNPAQLWHQWILNILLGILIMLVFSTISEELQLPLNTITSLFGIPVILLMFIKKRKLS